MLYPIPPVNGFGKDEMAHWDGFLTNDEINLILAQPEWLNTTQAAVGMGTIDPDMRVTQVNWLGHKPELMPIWEKLSKIVAEVNRRFFQFDLTGFYEPMQLGIYSSDSNGHYDWHTDATAKDKNAPRKLSIALMLSDPSEFEGGEFQVRISTDEPLTLETRRGRAWFFPSYVMHRVTPVTKGVRRSLVIWVGGPAFK
jgi:PKHD-type hydroxylase